MSTTDGDWTRGDWIAYADRLLDGARRNLSVNGAQVRFPGADGGYGPDVDGLEGFTRSLLIAGFRIAGERGTGVDHLIDFCVRGITAGVDPALDDRWVLLTEHAQAKVEAASIAVILDLTRPWVWERLDDVTRERLIDYLAPVVGDDTYPPTNWLWFRVVVQTFLRSVGGPWSLADIEADLALHDSLLRQDGWISDGPERSFDHYVGWALHLYPILWARMQGAADLAAGREAGDVERLDRYLADALVLVGADGSPLLQGRSLIYRFAAAAPFWAGVIAEVPSASAGALRHAADRIVRHFDDHGVPGESGVLTLGWHDEWRALAQSYSGPGSPYWAVKGLLGLSLPADHPVWSAPSVALPIEVADEMRAIAAPAWVVSATHADGIVRVINHGTDHAVEGTASADSPLYARLGYSTATSPMLDDESWIRPLDQTVALVDDSARATHRSGMRATTPTIDDGVGIVGSEWDAHWLDPRPTPQRHGSGVAGIMQAAGGIRVVSLVRGAWELRLVRVHRLDEPVAALRVGGWPIAGAAPAAQAVGASATVESDGVVSSLVALLGSGEAAIEWRDNSSPLGATIAVPYIDFAVQIGAWVAVLVGLSGSGENGTCVVELTQHDDELAVAVTWPDGHATAHRVTDPRPVVTTVGHPDRTQR